MAKKKAKKAKKAVGTEQLASACEKKDLVDCTTLAEQVGWLLVTIEKMYVDDYNIEKRLNQRIDRIVTALDKSKSVRGL